MAATICIAAGFVSGGRTPAQCELQWMSAGGLAGTGGPVHAVLEWDPDGLGGQPARRVVGGDFAVAGAIAAANVALCDPVAGWTALGAGTNGIVRALAALPNGDLIAAGDFTSAGGVAASRIARWNGAAWSPLGAGCDGSVRALAVLSNGDLVAAGAFTAAGGAAASRVARWNGTMWSALGAGANGTVHALAVSPGGTLFAGGSFLAAGGSAANRIASWNGVAWSPLGSGTGGTVQAIACTAAGDVIAGGDFATAGGVPCARVARWNGSLWSPLGGGADGSVTALCVEPSGVVCAGGAFQSAGGSSARGVARWDGVAWTGVGVGSVGTVLAVAPSVPGGLLIGGQFSRSPANHVARWDGASWSPLAPGSGGQVQAAVRLGNGDLVVGGSFRSIGGIAANSIARWDGASWHALGNGLVDTLLASVAALAVLPNGDIVAAGVFGEAGGAPATNIARWDGAAWHALGAGVGVVPQALVVLPNGDLLVGGTFATAGGVPVANVARWDGNAWSPVGSGLPGPSPFHGVYELALLPSGDVVAGGTFTAASGAPSDWLARWDGAAWQPFGVGTNGAVQSLAASADGWLYVGGAFTSAGGVAANHVARWDGGAWQPLGAGLSGGFPFTVNALQVLPGGRLIAGGVFLTAGTVPAVNVARWDGGAWSSLGVGVDNIVSALAAQGSGEVFVGGSFTHAGGAVSAFHAWLEPSCPAAAGLFGRGCQSAGGGSSLEVAAMPWVGATFRADAPGQAPIAVAISVTSVTPVTPGLPLSLVLADALPGCDLRVAPDILLPLLTTTGVVESTLFLAEAPPLAGVTFYHQLVVLDASLQVGAITVTDALVVTAGTY